MAMVAPVRKYVSAERKFFFIMAIVFAVTAVLGFSLSYSRMAQPAATLPIQIHLHAMVFVSWIGFYLLQNWLIANGALTIHRQIGWIGAVLAVLMVVLGLVVTVMCLRRGAVPFFFPPGVFLLIDGLAAIVFGVLVAAALRRRRQADWHKRLMLCAMAVVVAPAIGRILPMPLLGFWAPVGVFIGSMLYIVAGMAFDIRARGAIHVAYWWGTAAQTLIVTVTMIVGNSAAGLALANWLARG